MVARRLSYRHEQITDQLSIKPVSLEASPALMRLHHERTLVTEIRPLENEHHVQPFLSYLHSQRVEEEPGVQDMEALIDTIQKQLKDRPCSDNISEAFQIYDRSKGYVDRRRSLKLWLFPTPS